MTHLKSLSFALLSATVLAGCSTLGAPFAATADTPVAAPSEVAVDEVQTLVPFQQFELENGLDVIFHIDRSDPVVAVSLTAHVGSGRERPGRTGFAHLFEHLLFLESENLGKGGLDAMSARIGGSGANGSTSRDWTNYFQTVPNNALEKMIWAEADKLGWFINTVTDPVLAKEKQVVKNEKRQSVDNQPYGHLFSVLRSNMYPETHPYHWEVIGSLEDVQAATLDDVKTFYRAWYTPNNVTLVVAGDFDTSQAREWVETYFSEIPRGPDIEARAPQPAVLEDSLSFVHEDSFAEQPLIAMAWPTVPEYHPDSYPLAVLADLLSEGKRAPLNEVLIDEAQQTAAVTVFAPHNELAGEFITIITAFEDIDLDDVKASLEAGFDRFETDGVSAAALERVKIAQEVDFYRGLQSVLGKSINLAQYSIFTGDPGYADAELAALRAVTAEDVMRVYETYVKDQAYVAASFVPKGSPQLALNGAKPANVTEEQILADAEDDFDPNIEATYEPTPSVIDRSVEPPAGPTPVLATPDIWETELENGMKVLGIEDDELPIVEFVISIDGGHLADSVAQNGRANFVAEMLTRGTKTKTPAELQEAISDLGAEITASVSDEAILVRGRALARNFDPVMDLLTEIMTEPRWDGEEFDLAKSLILNEIVGLKANPGALAQLASAYTRYGADDIRAHSTFGSQTSVEALTLEDLKAFHGKYIVPHLASFRVVGDISEAEVRASLGDLEATWARTDLEPITVTRPLLPSEPKVYFYDVPGSKQSTFLFGHPGLLRTDDDFFPVTVANYRLGGGGFASRLMQTLREGKGYTYGIFSEFDGSARDGDFTLFSRIRSNVTSDATDIVRSILSDYSDTFTEEDLAVTKSFFLNAQAREFESFRAKLELLENIDLYNLPYDFAAQQTATVEAITVEDIQTLATTYIRPDRMSYVIVGDAATQLEPLEALGIGAPVLITEEIDRLME